MDFVAARMNMVNSQLRTNKVTDPVLISALRTVPREEFVSKPSRGVAYIDSDIHLEDERYLIKPMILARLIQLLQIEPEDLVLEIGCATGYGAVVMSHMCCAVIALDSSPTLAARAETVMQKLAINNVVIIEAPLATGYSKQAPYNAILFNGAVACVPDMIVNHLADGGRLAVVEKPDSGPGCAVLITRFGDKLIRRKIFDAEIPFLPNLVPEVGFVL